MDSTGGRKFHAAKHSYYCGRVDFYLCSVIGFNVDLVDSIGSGRITTNPHACLSITHPNPGAAG
jgi:hypothetical protein